MNLRTKFDPSSSKVGLALGGGGAKGLAHIPHLQAIDELGLPVDQIAGTSIGALIGAFYASGMSGDSIRELFLDILTHSKASWFDLSQKTTGKKWYQLVGLKMSGTALLAINPVIEKLSQELPYQTFEELPIPLKVVASDFWNRRPQVFSSGPLVPALRASVSIAGLFEPLLWEGKVLVDGGAVNPVPFDLLPQDHFRIAIDVLGEKKPSKNQLLPRLFESMFNTYQIMEETIVLEKLKNSPVDIYLKPELPNIRVMEFHRFTEILNSAQASVDQLKTSLSKWSEV